MVMNIDNDLARYEYDALSYNTRCWLRLRGEIVATLMLVAGIAVGVFVMP